ncbi:MAG: RluA family pseudouridine synthase [Myxococcota bacterium]
MSRRIVDPLEHRERRLRRRDEGIVRPRDIHPEAVMRVLRVPPEGTGTRLDRFLQRQLRATSRTRAQAIIARCAYGADGRRLRKNHRLRGEERVVLWRPPWGETIPADTTLPVLYEDRDLLAINKPPFVVVHPTARHHRATVAVLLAAARPDEHLTLLHRIDRETSGVLLLARTRRCDREVKLQFEARAGVEKTYEALVWGWPEWTEHHCTLPLEPDDTSAYRVKMRVARAGRGQACATTFEVIGRRCHPEDPTRRYARLRVSLHTGRQHQIRVHAAALGLPLVGDKLYGPDDTLHARGADGALTGADLDLLELPRQALHARRMVVRHPTTGASLSIEGPVYDDMRQFWARLAHGERGT